MNQSRPWQMKKQADREHIVKNNMHRTLYRLGLTKSFFYIDWNTATILKPGVYTISSGIKV